jgi:hypothetical protein
LKTKPALHIKKGDVIHFKGKWTSTLRSEMVVKVNEYDLDNDFICIHFGPQTKQLSNGQKKEVQPKFMLLFHKNEQILYGGNEK